MSPEYGATCGFFPVDELTLELPAPDRPQRRADRARRGVLQGEHALARPERGADLLAGGRARPRRPSSRRSPARAARRTACRSRTRRRAFLEALGTFGVDPITNGSARPGASPTRSPRAIRRPSRRPAARAEPEPDATPVAVAGARPQAACRSRAPTTSSSTARVVIAAITSCTNTSNPQVMVGAGLLAKKARRARPAAASRG